MGNGNDKELDDIWRELTEPRVLESTMSDMLPDKGESADAKDGRAMLGRVVLKRFRVDRFLDGGAVGRIFRGTQLGLGRPVAIKVLRRQEGPRGELAKKRFVREARFLAAMNHPNIVEMFDFGETEDGDVVMVMELLEGHTLKDHIAQGAPMSVTRVLNIGHQLAQAAGRAHDLNGVHRDLKPANVFLERDEFDRDLVKVLDFGLVKPAGKKSPSSSITLSGYVLGTPFYMSPEQAMSERLDARADIYSLAVILYEMLTGVPPFRGDTVAEILAKHLEAPPPPLAAGNPRVDVPVQLELLIRRCLAKSPSDRPESMYTVSAELEKIEKAYKQREHDLQETLEGWDPNERVEDAQDPANRPTPVEPTPSPKAEATQDDLNLVQPIWDDGTPLPQGLDDDTSQSGRGGPWDERSRTPYPIVEVEPWQERSVTPAPDSNPPEIMDPWDERSGGPLPPPALPPIHGANPTPPRFGQRATPLALQPGPATDAPSPDPWAERSDVEEGLIAPSTPDQGLPSMTSEEPRLLPPPSLSPPPTAGGLRSRRGRGLLLLFVGLILIGLALGLVDWAERSFLRREVETNRIKAPRAQIRRGPVSDTSTERRPLPRIARTPGRTTCPRSGC